VGGNLQGALAGWESQQIGVWAPSCRASRWQEDERGSERETAVLLECGRDMHTLRAMSGVGSTLVSDCEQACTGDRWSVSTHGFVHGVGDTKACPRSCPKPYICLALLKGTLQHECNT